MAGRFSLFANRIILFFNIIVAIIFLLACLAPFLDPAEWWYISFLGLGFVFFFILVLSFAVFWLIFYPRYIWVSLLAVLIGWKSIAVFFAFNSSSPIAFNKPKDVLRIVHWNVARFIEWRKNNNKGSQTRLKMMDLMRQQNADVLCLQEFFHSTDPNYYNNVSYVRNKLKYPYYYYSWTRDAPLQWIGQAIFSKYPIVGHGIVEFPKPGLPETLIYADVLFNNDTVRFYTTHLQSVQFKKGDYEAIQKIKRTEDSLLKNSKNIFTKLKRAIVIRSQQARIVKEVTSQSPHPTIITGDFNDVPNSYTYFTIKGDMQDVFLKKGFGIGRTFSGIAPTLRIDYILASQHFTVDKFNLVAKNFSDHYMLVTDLKLSH